MLVRFVSALLLFAAAATAQARDAGEVYTGHSGGRLTIDGEGRVIAVELDNRDLGEEIVAAYEQQIRTWRFEPIVEDGRPVNARARMQLSLLAFRAPDQDGMRLAFEKVQFVDPEPSAPPAVLESMRTAPPRYPANALRAGLGGMVQLAVRVGPDGRPVDVASIRFDLLGDVPRGTSGDVHAAQLQKAASDAAMKWEFPDRAGQVVLMPVRFSPGTGRGWLRTRSIAIDVPEWVTIAMAEDVAIELGESGIARPASPFRLLTPIGG